MTFAAVRPSARRGAAVLISALLALALASCLSDEGLTGPPPVDEPTPPPAFADAAHLAALGAALEDVRTRLLPGLQGSLHGAALSEGIEPAVRGLEAALAAQDAAAFTRRLPRAEAALGALEDGNAPILVELAAVGLVIEAARAAVRAAPADDAPSY